MVSCKTYEMQEELSKYAPKKMIYHMVLRVSLPIKGFVSVCEEFIAEHDKTPDSTNVKRERPLIERLLIEHNASFWEVLPK